MKLAGFAAKMAHREAAARRLSAANLTLILLPSPPSPSFPSKSLRFAAALANHPLPTSRHGLCELAV
jgi:hypothetical protein